MSLRLGRVDGSGLCPLGLLGEIYNSRTPLRDRHFWRSFYFLKYGAAGFTTVSCHVRFLRMVTTSYASATLQQEC